MYHIKQNEDDKEAFCGEDLSEVENRYVTNWLTLKVYMHLETTRSRAIVNYDGGPCPACQDNLDPLDFLAITEL